MPVPTWALSCCTLNFKENEKRTGQEKSNLVEDLVLFSLFKQLYMIISSLLFPDSTRLKKSSKFGVMRMPCSILANSFFCGAHDDLSSSASPRELLKQTKLTLFSPERLQLSFACRVLTNKKSLMYFW